MKRIFLLIIVFSFAAAPCVFSVPLENLISPVHAERLLSGDELIIEAQLRNPAARLLPRNSDLRQFVSGAMDSLNPNMLVEALYLYRKPARFQTAGGSWDDRQRAGILNQMASISSLAGIQYYSASRGGIRTFYETSVVIDRPETRNPLPDPVFENAPAGHTLYTRQKDLTFGDNIYRFDYVTTRDTVFCIQENVTSLSMGIIPVIGRGNLKTVIAVIDCGDNFLIYAASMVRALSVPGLADRISNSFRYRAEAILQWLSGRLDSELFSL
jgi:hypothetical protein